MSGRGFSIGGTAYALGYNYDGEGRLTVVTYPDGNKAVYYRTNGAVNSVQLVVGSASFAGASAVTYRPADMAMTSWTSSNGLVNSLGYDSDGRLTSISVPGIQNLSFGYDTANRITHIGNGIDTSMTQTVGYDAMSRVTSMSSTADNESYRYDADGNRLTSAANGASTTYTTDANNNRLLSANTTSSGNAQYGYDAQGNTSTKNGSVAYQYNPFNRLSQSGGATFYVNPEGQRLRKAGGSTGVTYFAPDISGALMAENDNGTWVDYVRLNGRLIGRISGGQVHAIHTDQVDRPDTVTNASRNVIWHAKNYPFGNTVTQANITLNLGFPGQYYDAETWLWNNGYRDYNSASGRYIESDPIGLRGGANTYAYAGSNPLMYTDPYGLWSVTFGGYFGAGFELTFGNDNGNKFLTARVGLGLGAGISWDPNGAIPGDEPKDRCEGGSVLSVTGQIGAHAGPVAAGWEAGAARNYQNQESGLLNGPTGSLTGSWGFGFGGSVGGQWTEYVGRRP